MSEHKKLFTLDSYAARAGLVWSIVGLVVIVLAVVLIVLTPPFVWGGIFLLLGIVVGFFGILYLIMCVVCWVDDGYWSWDVF